MATIGRVGVYAVLALIWVTPVAAQLATPEAAIRAQVQGFYRDDRDNRWPDVLDHFWVGKITARWTAPTSTQAWLAARPLERDSACVPGERSRAVRGADRRSLGSRVRNAVRRRAT